MSYHSPEGGNFGDEWRLEVDPDGPPSFYVDDWRNKMPPFAGSRARPWFEKFVQQVEAKVVGAGDTFHAPVDDPLHWNPRESNPRGDGIFGCLVAESHPQGRDAQVLNDLRKLRERFLLGSSWGKNFFERFHEHYYGFSTAVAKQLASDPEMRSAIGFAIASPLINYFRIVAQLPRLDEEQMANLPRPVRDFLGLVVGDIESWIGPTAIGESITGLTPQEAAIEIAIALRFKLRAPGSASAYLERLSAEGALPLRGSHEALASAAATMRALLASDDEVRRVIGAEGEPSLGAGLD